MNDIELYRKHRRYEVIEESDRELIKGLASIGIMNYGHRKNQEGGFSETAKLTSFGEESYRLERIRRSPVRRFFHNMTHGF